jgi:hypothetical protein
MLITYPNCPAGTTRITQAIKGYSMAIFCDFIEK